MTARTNEQWWSETESPKAWMSVRDADLYEKLLHRMAARLCGSPIRVLEWGGGRSTSWYTHFLSALGVPYSWLTIEHDRFFFEQGFLASLLQRGAMIIHNENIRLHDMKKKLADGGLTAVLFEAGELRPDLPDREADRLADLDNYVSLPARLSAKWDVIIIDGRKRRRCVLEAAKIVEKEGVVILHDAWRRYYQCAFTVFQSSRRFSDEWWIGSMADINFEELLPISAFERHVE